jgi:hypothetical protein
MADAPSAHAGQRSGGGKQWRSPSTELRAGQPPTGEWCQSRAARSGHSGHYLNGVTTCLRKSCSHISRLFLVLMMRHGLAFLKIRVKKKKSKDVTPCHVIMIGKITQDTSKFGAFLFLLVFMTCMASSAPGQPNLYAGSHLYVNCVVVEHVHR